MRKPVIYDRAPRRKRGSLLWWALRRFGALLLTLAVLGGVSWLAPRVQPAPLAPPDITVLEIRAPEPSLFPDAAPEGAPAPAATRPRRPAGIRLDAQPDAHPFDDLDVLSAGELAAISQARDDGASQFAHAAQAATTPRESEDARVREISDEQDQGRESRRRHGRR